MIFFSSIMGAEVRDQSDAFAGKIFDVAVKVLPEYQYPPILGVVVKRKGKKKYFDISEFEIFGREITLKTNARAAEKAIPDDKQLIFVRKNLLDKQIVDLAGVRVVRVNDLQLSQVQDKMCLVALEVGTHGLLRRMGWGWAARVTKPKLLDWKNVHLVGDQVRLSTDVGNLVKLHPADLANILEKLNLNQGAALLQSLDKSTAARVLEEVEPQIRKILVEHLGPEKAAAMAASMSTDDLVDLIQLLPHEKSDEIMEKLPVDNKTQKVRKILEYDEDTAGGLMSTEFLTAHPDMTVSEVEKEMARVSDQHRSIYFIYVTDEQGKFLGVVSLRRLILAAKGQKMKEVMKKVKRMPTVKPHYRLMRVASIMTKYNLMSVAVLDHEARLLGVVSVDDVMRHFVPKA